MITNPSSGPPAGLRKLVDDMRQRGIADDMTPEDWAAMRRGFSQWMSEEEREGEEHGEDAEFKESDHPRDNTGKFGSGGGGKTSSKDPAREGRIAAGFKGGTPGEQGEIAAKTDAAAVEHSKKAGLAIIKRIKRDSFLGKYASSDDEYGNDPFTVRKDGSVEVSMRDVGQWVNPPGKEREEDYDWKVPTKETEAKVKAAVASMEKELGVKISVSGGEKSYTYFRISAPKAGDESVATDSALRLALDRESIREKSKDGHLHVARTPISKATVNPYRGAEIPNCEELGLDPEEIYYLLRDPDELAKAAASFNGKPLLRKHVPVSAEDHAAHDTIGAVMNDAAFEDPYLKASLSVWPQDDIDDIESEAKKELSSGYHYRAEMTPGNFRGMRYDGVMRDIVGNHVALVKDGRAGPDVVVGDSMESLMAKPTRFAALTLGLVAANVAPLIAKDSKIELPKGLFSSITTKNFQTKRTELLGGVRAALDGKLRKGLALDASMEQVGKVMDNVAGLFGEKGGDESVSEEQHNAMEAAAHGESNLGIPKSVGEEFEKADKGKSFDAEPLKNFLREKGMGEDDIKAAFDMLPKPGTDASEEEQAEKTEEEKKAAVSEAVEKERKAMDEKLKGMVTKTAMDEAIKAAAKTTRETERGIRAALDFVRPYVGELASSLALDSADDVYRHAAVAMKIDGAKDIHPSALPTLIKMLPKPGARQTEHTSIAQDEATVTDFEKRFPNATRIQPGA